MEVGAERHHRNREQRADQGNNRRGDVKRAINAVRDYVFFEEKFGAVSERLEQAKGAHTAGSPAILDAPDYLALEEHGVGDAHQQNYDHHQDFHNGEDDK